MSSFVNGWINQLGTQQSVNGFTVPARVSSNLSASWPKLGDGVTFDMSQAPFQLLAIVNRTDLHATGQGEGRLVFGFVGPQSAPVSDVGPQPFTVIAEFLLPATASLPNRKAWVNAFFALPNAEGFQQVCAGSTNPLCVYNHNLQTLTDAFITPGQLLDLRTSDFLLAPPGVGDSPGPWAWRQFLLQTATGQNHLVTATTPEVPDISLNNSANIGAFLAANAPQIRDGFVSLPPSDIGGEAFDFVPPWSFPTVDATTLTSFSGRTCNGCHQFINTDPTNPTGTQGPFFHVNPTVAQDSTGQNILSAFVKDIEVPRRESFMTNWLTCNSGSQPCGNGVEVALTQF